MDREIRGANVTSGCQELSVNIRIVDQSTRSRLPMKQRHCQQKLTSTEYWKIINFNFRLSACCEHHQPSNTHRWRSAHPPVCFRGAVSGPPFGRAHTVPRPHVLRWPVLNRCCPGGPAKAESWPKIGPKETISSFSIGKYQETYPT